MTEIAPIAVDTTGEEVPSSRAPQLELSEALMASPERFFNRELSWLAFNGRVLEESRNPRHPLLERLRFLSISANNLDEFYMVRVAGLKGAGARGRARRLSQDGLTPAEQLVQVNAAAGELMADQQRQLARAAQASWPPRASRSSTAPRSRAPSASGWRPEFLNQLFPVLTPLAIDPAHPFPFIPNLGFSLALKLRRATATAGSSMRWCRCPTQVRAVLGRCAPTAARRARRSGGSCRWRTCSLLFLDHLFPGCEVEEQGVFRLIRDSDIEIEEEAEDLVRGVRGAR